MVLAFFVNANYQIFKSTALASLDKPCLQQWLELCSVQAMKTKLPLAKKASPITDRMPSTPLHLWPYALNVGDTVPSRGQDWFVSWELRKSYFYAQYTVRHRKQWLLRLLGGGADDVKRPRQVD